MFRLTQILFNSKQLKPQTIQKISTRPDNHHAQKLVSFKTGMGLLGLFAFGVAFSIKQMADQVSEDNHSHKKKWRPMGK